MSRFLTAHQHKIGYSIHSAIHVGTRWKIRTEDKSITDITKTKNNTEKANNTKRSKTKLGYPCLVAFYDTRPRNEVRYSTMLPSPHGATETHEQLSRRVRVNLCVS